MSIGNKRKYIEAKKKVTLSMFRSGLSLAKETMFKLTHSLSA